MIDRNINYYSTQKDVYFKGIKSFMEKEKKIHYGDCDFSMAITNYSHFPLPYLMGYKSST